MARPTTEQLKDTLKKLIDRRDEAVKVKKACNKEIIAINAILQDREAIKSDA